REYYTNRILYTLITVAVSGVCLCFCNLVPLEGIIGLIVRGIICTCLLLVLIPAMMYLLKREYTKESTAFVKQIIEA
ncbi:MAG: hypothetical protein J5966_05510, partial [Lachnospiraceae bacterium]|nr:hypothetical protein [Lachnospiraceae bacterium]